MRVTHESQLLALFSMIVADASSDPAELAFLFQWAHDKGVAPDAIRDIILNPAGIPFAPPSDVLESVGQLYDLARIIVADGVIHDEEKRLLGVFARRFGFSDDIVPKLVDQLLAEVSAGHDRDSVINAAKAGIEG